MYKCDRVSISLLTIWGPAVLRKPPRIKEILSLETSFSCLTSGRWYMQHNKIPLKLEKALAHLCGCSKIAKNSPEGDNAKEALRLLHGRMQRVAAFCVKMEGKKWRQG